MASGTLGDSVNDLSSRGRQRWAANSKVYSRRIHRKAQRTINNNGSATTTTSFVASTPTLPDVSSATVAAVAASVVFNNSAAASPGPIGSPVATVSSLRNACDDRVQESVDALVAAQESICEKQSPSHTSAEKNVDSSLELQQPQQIQHQERKSSLSEANYSSQTQMQEGISGHITELQYLGDSSLRDSNEFLMLKKTSTFPTKNELLQTTGDVSLNSSEASPPSRENYLPNNREVAAVRLPIGNDPQNDGELMPVLPQVPSGNGPVDSNGVGKPLGISKIDDRVRFHLSKATSKNEIEKLRKKLESELNQVRRLVKQLEAKELQLSLYNTQVSNSNLSNSSNYVGIEDGNIGGYGNSRTQPARNDAVDRRVLLRVNSEVDVMGNPETRPMGLARVNSDLVGARNIEPRPYSRQLSVAVMENNQRTSEFVEKEKRTPKANQYYRKSEFLLGKDRLPPESNKRLKTSNGRKHRGETEYAFGFGFGFDKSRNQVFKSCSSLLQRLMKHKHGWVFNEPVNAKALNLLDYHDIIKHPMDLGTIKTRLSQNWYKSPREFAEDVRLVFRNAMTYNPKGQDVHFMAEQLSEVFEERWAIIETEYNPYWKYQMYLDAGLHTPASRKAPPQSHFAPVSAPPAFTPAGMLASAHVATPLYAPAAPNVRPLDRPESITVPMAVDSVIHRPHVGRTPVPKKPKAKDLNKRDMTYDEKQRLSTNLQSLPSEKLDVIVQIIKRRNTALSQHDDEIEVDIDSVDPETLWELDRFVTNYKKSLSKNKRKAELALQARAVANKTVATANTTPAVAEIQIQSGTGEKQGYNGSRSSSSHSSSSSSSDSGSSSTDSDSDSSSADGSDQGNSPKT